MRLNVRPNPPLHDVQNRLLRNGVVSSETVEAHLACAVRVPDFAHRLFGEFCSWVRRTRRATSACAMLALAILHVRLSSSEKQVLGVHAWRIIASMADIRGVWDPPAVQFPRQAVCTMSGESPATAQCPVATGFQSRPSPEPTAGPEFRMHWARFVDVATESGLNWTRFSRHVSMITQ